MSASIKFHFLEKQYYDKKIPQDKIEESINQIHDKLEKTEIILRQSYYKSSKPEEIKQAIDQLMKPINIY